MKRLALALCFAGCGLEKPVLIDAPTIDARTVDANPDAYVCINDMHEPNNTLSEATPMPSGSGMQHSLSGTLCPGDQDVYTIVVSISNKGLEVLVDRQNDKPDLQAAILNSGGTALANAVPVTNMQRRIRAFISNVPSGTYYAQVSGSSTEAIGNSYDITMTSGL